MVQTFDLCMSVEVKTAQLESTRRRSAGVQHWRFMISSMSSFHLVHQPSGEEDNIYT